MTDNRPGIALIGLGNRGKRYLEWILDHPEACRLAALVDPDPVRLKDAVPSKGDAEVDPKMFRDHAEFFAAPAPRVDAVVIACPDRLHYPIAMQAIGRGMHVLIEKPMGTTPQECREIARVAGEKGVVASVCYELHHHPYYLKIDELLRDSRMGRLVGATHTVNSGLDRSLHNFVRGLWSREEAAGPVFLSKCSHDVDLFIWLCREKVASYSSSGSLSFFRRENAPEGSAARCVDCKLERDCAFSAVDLYKRGKSGWTQYIALRQGETLSDAIDRELREGPFGRCAFKCNNDVYDHQMVTLTMESGALVNIFMNFLTREDSRVSYFSCTGGEIWADWKTVRYRFFDEGEVHSLDFSAVLSQPFHAGSDFALIEDFVSAVAHGTPLRGTSVGEALGSHLVCLCY